MGLQLGQAMGHAAMAHDGGHASERKVHGLQGQADKALVAAVMGGRHVLTPGYGSVGGSNHLHVVRIDMADGVGARPHGAIVGSGGGSSSSGSIGAGDAVLPRTALGGSGAAGALPAVPGAGRRGGGLMELLLVAQQQVSAGKASAALGALEGLLLGVGALVTLQMLEAGEGALTGGADMRTGLIGLGQREGGGRRDGRGRFGGRIHGDGGRWSIGSHCQ